MGIRGRSYGRAGATLAAGMIGAVLVAGTPAGAAPVADRPAGAGPVVDRLAGAGPVAGTAAGAAGWRVVASPSPGSYAQPRGVFVAGPHAAWLVGSQRVDPAARTLVERWDGTSWQVEPSPNASALNNYLDGVDGTSASDVWAVGNAYAPAQYGSPHGRALIEHNDGTGWRIVPNGLADTDISSLNAVSALAPDDAWAVGTRARHTLAEHWDGTTWTPVPTPDLGTYGDRLNTVEAVSPTNVWAAGTVEVAAAGHRHHSDPVIIHWDGTSWTVVPSPNPNPAAGTGYIEDLVALSPTDIWAVGTSYSGPTGFALHWNGTAWTAVPAPGPNGDHTEFHAVTARSADDVWLVGSHADGIGSYLPLVEHWNGTAWTVESLPGGEYQAGLYAVAAGPAVVWSAGEQWGSDTDSLPRTYTMRSGNA